jgi:hypothetical protein
VSEDGQCASHDTGFGADLGVLRQLKRRLRAQLAVTGLTALVLPIGPGSSVVHATSKAAAKTGMSRALFHHR